MSTNFNSNHLSNSSTNKLYHNDTDSISIFSNVSISLLSNISYQNETDIEQQYIHHVNNKANYSFLNKDLNGKILAVAIPSCAACLAEPLITMVDLFFIGRFSSNSAIGLAGMAVNGAIFNILTAFTSSLCTSTTLISSSQQAMTTENQSQNDTINLVSSIPSKQQSLSSVLANGVTLSLVLGIFITIILNLFMKSILQMGFGMKQSSPIEIELFKDTMQYFRIRSLSIPFMLINLIVFGFSVSVENIIAPVMSIITSSIINIMLDYLFILPFQMGLPGAALATSISNIFGSLLGLFTIIKCQSLLLYNKNNSFKQNIMNYIQLINKNILRRYFTTSLFIQSGSIINTLTYSSSTRISSFAHNIDSSVLNIAASQIVMQLWWLLSFLSSPISLAAQALLPKENKNQSKIRFQM
eukprot:gene10482-14085_t